MIQLPEVETIRRDLDRDASGKKIKAVETKGTKTIKRSGSKKKFSDRVVGAKLSNVSRRGRFILIHLDNGEIIVTHLGDGAQLLRNANKDAVHDKTVVTLAFTQFGQIRLVDHTGNAQMFVVAADDLAEEVPELEQLGVDPLDRPMSWTDFGRAVLSHKVKLKSLLTDESFVVGLGDLYSDEILFNAGLRYDRISNSLTTQELRRFYRGLVETLHDAVKYRGTTLEKSHYTDAFGEPGSFQDHIQVYGREGELSPRSRRPIERAKFSGRWTYFCAQSQV